MRLSPIRVLPLLLSALVLCAGPLASAYAEEGDAPKRERSAQQRQIMRGLQAGIKSLRALGGNERVILHLQGLLAELQRPGRDPAPKGADAEKRRMGLMVGVMQMAQHALREAGRGAQAEVMEHGVQALKMLWSGRSDEEAMAILVTAPSQEAQANALFQAAEILGNLGQKRRAKACAVLGRKFHGDQEKGKRGPRRAKAQSKTQRHQEQKQEAGGNRGRAHARPLDPERGLAGLRERLSILRLARIALREGEQREAEETLERALHTAELLLEERQDEEAQRIYRNTPSLVELSQLLHLSARLWLKYEQPQKAEQVARLSRYYRLRAVGSEEAAAKEREDAEAQRDAAEARQRRGSTWALRQQRELEVRQRRARAEEVREQRRREHEQRLRAHEHRDSGTGRRERRAVAEDETTRRIDELRAELQDVQRALRELMRDLHEIVRDR